MHTSSFEDGFKVQIRLVARTTWAAMYLYSAKMSFKTIEDDGGRHNDAITLSVNENDVRFIHRLAISVVV